MLMSTTTEFFLDRQALKNYFMQGTLLQLLYQMGFCRLFWTRMNSFKVWKVIKYVLFN